ncbi:IQ domain-containing protein/BAG domain-containing protein [Cephalotus follicularis]|uniref:IQ domain-containing protein/BAG domain-containing protein n=1 Tax=Cephalotus follicularis TaxID=3775 RepID=A0A1Q3DEV6_CEPFO|nr:IQ domain-containing protein/BAG domain-containing protein [Cephalotus follicularis]
MDSPFFTPHTNLPSDPPYSSSARGIPVRHHQTKASPKVVSIPVHFVGSERTRSESAVKIQKNFRGFLVRKTVNEIAAIRKEVEEMEKRIRREESVELLRRDSKERLKVNEALMSLVLRLDSVRGVDSGIRDCRKKMIKTAIALQEAVDAIAAADNEAEIVAEAVADDAIRESVDDVVEEKEIIYENETPFGGEERQSEGLNEENDDEVNSEVEKEKAQKRRNRDVMERMMEEKERMVGLMSDLVERNERQSRMICSLTHRVGRLERALLFDRLMRKKRRHAAGIANNSLNSSF